ncbi:MAG TPA: HD domain-containing protein [Firmicutes bacterium]|nr:HD domain-containing protein [Candidatus Fermentithermobacillaceae bacterium]
MDELLWGFLRSVSKALDLSYSGIMPHHMRVAVLASKIARGLGLSQARMALTTQSALIHDLGVRTWGDRARLHNFEVDDPYEHAVDGYRILAGVGAGNPWRPIGRTKGEPGPSVRACGEGQPALAGLDRGGGGRALLLPHARVILHHHDKWEGGNPSRVCKNEIPIESRILHLADRVDVLLDAAKPFNYQKKEIFDALDNQRGRAFDPALVDVLYDLARSESFWFDLEPSFLAKALEACIVGSLTVPAGRDPSKTEVIAASIAAPAEPVPPHPSRCSGVESDRTGRDGAGAPRERSGLPVAPGTYAQASSGKRATASPSLCLPAASGTEARTPEVIEILEVLSRVFAEVVDRRSPYTRRHSQSVGECAFILGKHLGLDELTCRELRVAGLLHDLGKLGVSESILDKKASLTEEETCIVKRHPYLTYHLLDEVPCFDRIRDWASFHHERLDGRGYPFGLDSSLLSTEARVVAVCDVFSALSDDRPYRPGLSREQVQSILAAMVESGALDGEIVSLAGRVL